MPGELQPVDVHEAEPLAPRFVAAVAYVMLVRELFMYIFSGVVAPDVDHEYEMTSPQKKLFVGTVSVILAARVGASTPNAHRMKRAASAISNDR